MALSYQASNQIFDRIALRYDLVNTVLSLGLQRSWRERLARAFPESTRRVLDLACGTAAIPLAFLRCRPDITDITGIDISENMLAIGRARLTQAGAGKKVFLVKGDALELSFPSGSFDAVTVGFALRNVPDVMRLLLSAYRVLTPSGYFGVLEFSRPDSILPKFLQNVYLSIMVPFLGLVLTGNGAAYRHLGTSILQFPDRSRFLRMLRQAGFKDITVRPMALGAVTLYMVKK